MKSSKFADLEAGATNLFKQTVEIEHNGLERVTLAMSNLDARRESTPTGRRNDDDRASRCASSSSSSRSATSTRTVGSTPAAMLRKMTGRDEALIADRNSRQNGGKLMTELLAKLPASRSAPLLQFRATS